MSGEVFLDVLTDLGYPDIKRFDATSFDWLFDVDDTLQFLKWFCNHISTSNVLKKDQLAR